MIIDKQAIAYLRPVHGFYNIVVMFLFMYQGWLGIKIRKGRKSGKQSIKAVKRHRKAGPVLVLMGIFGYLAGNTLVYLDHGHFLEHSLHFITGSFIVLSIITTFFISRRIKSPESPWRFPHFRLGILIICLYLIQVFLGLWILILRVDTFN